MTLIDKTKLIRELRINPAGCDECEYADAHLNCTRGFQFASACESICEATEIDAAPVVRCKVCQYWEQAMPESGNCNRAFEITAYATDFCSYGERKTE